MANLTEEPTHPFAKDLVLSTEIPQYVSPTDQEKLRTNWVPNHLLSLTQLSNSYVVVRHGQSEANIAKIIASERHEFGGQLFGLGAQLGLTDLGRREVELYARAFARTLETPNGEILIIHSDLKRTEDTANIWGAVLSLAPAQIIPHKNLRERLYGVAEGQSEDRLSAIYAHDGMYAWSSFNRAEPLAQAVHRLTELILQLEREFQGKTIILVTHSSPAKALEAAFTLDFESSHAMIPKYGNGEFRKLQLGQV